MVGFNDVIMDVQKYTYTRWAFSDYLDYENFELNILGVGTGEKKKMKKAILFLGTVMI